MKSRSGLIMAVNGSYSGGADKTLGVTDIEYATDPASGGFFNSDYKKHDDLKHMLDMNKDSLKLEAMKRIIGMIAKGKDASDLFPSVVKNVVSKNIEVKKLVYVYLVRYAEEQQDLALLSISTFQRALRDPNQLIRASALRVLSSIRVSMIVPIVMLAIKDAASDMSPYVRKTAAHAIPKLYSLDSEQKEELVLVIDKLLSDKTTLVVGSTVMAFEEVCPERIDLIHKNYRKLCNLLADVDEWGQVIIVNMLTRYGRTQFVDPNINAVDEDSDSNQFYSDDNESDSVKEPVSDNKTTYVLDADHRLLLRNTKPLLQSRNAAVVMSVAQLYHHLAPRSDVSIVAKSLIRLLRSYREVQSIVLNSIASISIPRKDMFQPFLKSFFVRTNDATHIKILKLEILTNLATESNIAIILREFQTYVSSTDKQFVAATVHAIGRCASNIPEVRDSCLNGLVSMLSNRDEAVVAESVVVVKKLLQTHPNAHTDIIKHMAKLVDDITVPQARASILWLLGEYSHLVPTIAPDVLRKMAKTFINEEDIVKLQILNLAVKLVLTNEAQTKLLCQYVLTLARYDQNYDIRDRSRLLRQILFPQNENSVLTKNAKKIFLATKPAPLLQSKFIDREQFQMGSLSHYINARANGYHDLPSFPEVAPDNSARNVASETTPKVSKKQPILTKKKSFYSDSENSTPPAEDSDETDGNTDDEDNDSDENSDSDDSGEGSESDEASELDSDEVKKPTKRNDKRKELSSMSDGNEESSGSSSSSSDDASDSDDGDDDDSEDGVNKTVSSNQSKSAKTRDNVTAGTSNVDLLLELNDFELPPPISLSAVLPSTITSSNTVGASNSSIKTTNPSYVPNKTEEIISKINGMGQLSARMRFTRSPFVYNESMVSLELIFHNHFTDSLTDIKIGERNLSAGMSIHDYEPIAVLLPNEEQNRIFGVAFNDTTKSVELQILWNCKESTNSVKTTFKAPIGELMRPVVISEILFIEEQNKLKGMNEYKGTVTTTLDDNKIIRAVYETANFGPVICSDSKTNRYCGQTLASKSLVLATLVRNDNSTISLTVNCEKMVVGSMIFTDIKNHLANF